MLWEEAVRTNVWLAELRKLIRHFSVNSQLATNQGSPHFRECLYPTALTKLSCHKLFFFLAKPRFPIHPVIFGDTIYHIRKRVSWKQCCWAGSVIVHIHRQELTPPSRAEITPLRRAGGSHRAHRFTSCALQVATWRLGVSASGRATIPR